MRARCGTRRSPGRPIGTRTSSGETNAGASAGVTSNVLTTARWSDGHGSTTTSDIGSSSPTTRLDSVSDEPAAHTKSIRSNTSHGEMPGWPDVHVKPGSAIASGRTSRNESRNPARSITSDVGQRTENRGAR